MALSSPGKRWTEAQYLAHERASDQRSTLAGGEVFARAGAKRAHNLVVANLITALCNALRDRPCEVYPSDMRVKVSVAGLYTYPDASVVCSAPQFEDAELDTLLNPEVLFEVLSDSTEAYDRGDKFAAYQGIPGLRDYVLVSTRRRRVERFSRAPGGGWHLEAFEPGAEVKLALGCVVALDDLYLKVPGV